MASDPNDPPRVPVPDYRPVERFWPYVDLPEQPTDEELAALSPELSEALFGAPKLPFSVTLEFPAFDGGDYARAIEMARASAEYRTIGDGERLRHRARFYPKDAVALRDLFDDRRPARRHRRPHRRQAGAVCPGALAAPGLVSDQVIGARERLTIPHPDSAYGRTHRSPEGFADAGRRAQAARGRVQHVLRRAPAAAAIGDAQPRGGAGQEVGSRLHPGVGRPLSVRHAAAPLPDVRGSLGSRPAGARGGARGSVPGAAAEDESGKRSASRSRRWCMPRPSRIRCARWTSCTPCTIRSWTPAARPAETWCRSTASPRSSRIR